MAEVKDQLNHEPEAVAYAREKAGLNQIELAALLGVTSALISMWESGQRSVTPKMLPKLADAVNCPVVVLERKRAARVARVRRPRKPAEEPTATAA